MSPRPRYFATFAEWRERALRTTADETPVMCPDCRGHGFAECGECGHARDCERCDSEGTVAFGDLDEYAQRSVLDRAAYHDALLADARALAHWLEQDLTELLVGQGFIVASRLATHELRIIDTREAP